MTVYFTSDTHFGDPRVLRIDRRPYPDLATHDAALVENWNAVVEPDDTVWHLGDFALGPPPERVIEILASLHGRKHLIVGNNDGPATLAAQAWESVAHYAEIKKLHQSLNATSIYVTHDQIEAMTLADRIVAMEGGEIQQIGSPLDLYERPANRFVAGFIGSPAMNFLEGRVRQTGDVAFLDLGGTRRVPLPSTVAVLDGTPLTLGVRPEHVLIGADAAGSNLECPVELVEPTGMGTIVHCDLNGIAMKAFVPGVSSLRAGDTVPLRLAGDHLHLFAADGGARLN